MTKQRMIDLLKIELQCVTRKSNTNCTGCNLCDLVQDDAELQSMYVNVIALLEEDSPQVVAVEKLRECVTYWVEDENGHVVPETIMDISGKNVMTIPVVHLTNGYAPIITKTTDGYNSKRFTGWRCWTSRPSDEQMKAVKWE